MSNPDAHHPTLVQAAVIISELAWEYVNTHTREECEEVKRRVEKGLRERAALFGPLNPQIIAHRDRAAS